MMHKVYSKMICLFLLIFFINPLKAQKYFIINKGIYIDVDNRNMPTSVRYKENESFTFSLKNDTTAIIIDMKKGKPLKSTKYKVSRQFDTAYIKRFSFIDGKKKIHVEKVIYRKVYP